MRCVEVTLAGWDTHADNHDGCQTQKKILDPAFAALIGDLKTRGLLDRTIVLCAGEFGRTPHINRLGGRDHWPSGFSVALSGGNLRGGIAIGETDPAGTKDVKIPTKWPTSTPPFLRRWGSIPSKKTFRPSAAR